MDIENKPMMWEILVPTIMNGKPVKTRYHRVWDGHVRFYCGGLTILRPVKGQWVEPVSQELYEERMIPVRIGCTLKDFREILKFTKEYYNQKVVMAYKISDEFILYNGEQKC